LADVDRIKELAAQGMVASEIAKESGISRQRVYQLAARHKINLTKYDFAARTAFSPPVPRITTGGVQAKVSCSIAGTIAELLVAADLMARGWAVYMPIMFSRGYDIIAAKDGALATIEVRSAHRKIGDGGLSYNKKIDSDSAYHALVITGEPVCYRPELPS
jgi:hypothetical protein